MNGYFLNVLEPAPSALVIWTLSQGETSGPGVVHWTEEGIPESPTFLTCDDINKFQFLCDFILYYLSQIYPDNGICVERK